MTIFSTQLPLLEDLHERGIRATGSLHKSHLQDCNVTSVKDMEKTMRGTYSEMYTKELCVVQYNDNKVVTMASNFETAHSEEMVLRRVKGKKRKNTCKAASFNSKLQPVYGRCRFVWSLHPCIGGKKWYWMALVNYIRVLQLVAFIFYDNCHNRKTAQLDFLWNIVIEISSKMNNRTHNRTKKKPLFTTNLG